MLSDEQIEDIRSVLKRTSGWDHLDNTPLMPYSTGDPCYGQPDHQFIAKSYMAVSVLLDEVDRLVQALQVFETKQDLKEFDMFSEDQRSQGHVDGWNEAVDLIKDILKNNNEPAPPTQEDYYQNWPGQPGYEEAFNVQGEVEKT